MRIVSLLPSATEMIHALGLGEALVGVTHECDFPPGVSALPHVTQSLIRADASSAEIDSLVRERLSTDRALYRLNLAELQRLEPDLIITQSLCNVCAVAETEVQAAACSLPTRPTVINLEPQSLAEVFEAIGQLGVAAGVSDRAEEVIRGLTDRVRVIVSRSKSIRDRPRVAFLEWLDPPFSCGHWTPELVEMAGGVEGLSQPGQPSRTLDWAEVVDWQPEVVFIACCGFNIGRTWEDLPVLSSVSGWSQLPAVQSDRVYVTDGSQFFSRPGPRLVESLEILAHALHPSLHPLPGSLCNALSSVRRGRAGSTV